MRRILIADDNPGLCSALALLLETRLGAHIVGAVSTMEAVLEQVAGAQPEVVILNWELPGQPADGRLEALRRIAPDVKIVVTSLRPEAAAAVRAGPADAFINKTDLPEEILNAVQKTKQP